MIFPYARTTSIYSDNYFKFLKWKKIIFTSLSLQNMAYNKKQQQIQPQSLYNAMQVVYNCGHLKQTFPL